MLGLPVDESHDVFFEDIRLDIWLDAEGRVPRRAVEPGADGGRALVHGEQLAADAIEVAEEWTDDLDDVRLAVDLGLSAPAGPGSPRARPPG